jgi:hypothetical protein
VKRVVHHVTMDGCNQEEEWVASGTPIDVQKLSEKWAQETPKETRTATTIIPREEGRFLLLNEAEIPSATSTKLLASCRHSSLAQD